MGLNDLWLFVDFFTYYSKKILHAGKAIYVINQRLTNYLSEHSAT